LWAQWDSPPVLGGYPTNEWTLSEVITDRTQLPVGADTPPGTYRLFAGMYDEATGERLPLVWQGHRLAGDTIELALITVLDQPAERTP
jgi:hypothetical protein